MMQIHVTVVMIKRTSVQLLPINLNHYSTEIRQVAIQRSASGKFLYPYRETSRSGDYSNYPPSNFNSTAATSSWANTHYAEDMEPAFPPQTSYDHYRSPAPYRSRAHSSKNFSSPRKLQHPNKDIRWSEENKENPWSAHCGYEVPMVEME